MSAPRIGANKTMLPGVSAAARALKCRVCGAIPGRPCLTPSGKRKRASHAPRLRDGYSRLFEQTSEKS